MTVAKRNLDYLANRFGSKWTYVVAHKLRFNPAIPSDLVNALAYYEEISPTLAKIGAVFTVLWGMLVAALFLELVLLRILNGSW